MHSTFNEKIALIREKIREEKADAVIIGTRDPHQSPRTLRTGRVVQWLTGFSAAVWDCFVVTDKTRRFGPMAAIHCRQTGELSGTDIHIYIFRLQCPRLRSVDSGAVALRK